MSTSTAVDPAILNATNAAPARCPLCNALVTAAGTDCAHESDGAELVRRLAFLLKRKPARFCVLLLRVAAPSASLEDIGREAARILGRPQALSRQAISMHCHDLSAEFPSLAGWVRPGRNGG